MITEYHGYICFNLYRCFIDGAGVELLSKGIGSIQKIEEFKMIVRKVPSCGIQTCILILTVWLVFIFG